MTIPSSGKTAAIVRAEREGWRDDEAFARSLDEADPLRGYRDRFTIPTDSSGREVSYFVGNSLGLQPKAAAEVVQQDLADWATYGVDGHFEATRPWYDYHAPLAEPAAHIVGAEPHEVVVMNSLTVNLHLLMASFYRPQRTPGGRRKILFETPTFPSDRYALETQAIHHGLDPADALIEVNPREGEACVRPEDLIGAIQEAGEELALVLVAGVNFATGQALPLKPLADAAHGVGALFGVDLAHAAGNLNLSLHADDVDFAAWCSYKYLNGGPGAISGAFVHDRHARNRELPRLAGWWGNDPATRFNMHAELSFHPVASADAWQMSNPPILAMAPLRASYAMFAEATLPALRRKSEALTGYLEWSLRDLVGDRLEILTPTDPSARGCQLSLRFREMDPAESATYRSAREVRDALQAAGCVCDFRPPDVIRIAPVPLYNTFRDAWRVASELRRLLTV